MIVAADILRNLRKTNISVNADKTQQRIKEDFSSASRAVKKEIETLSGQAGRNPVDDFDAAGKIQAVLPAAYRHRV